METFKQSTNWKVEDIEAGYDILLNRMETEDPNYLRPNNSVEEAVGIHAEISRRLEELLGTTPIPLNEAGAAQARLAGDQVKLKEGLKPTTLTLGFNSQEFQAWQNKFKINYRTSRMNTANAKEQQDYLYLCVLEHLQAVILRNTPHGSEHILGRWTSR